MEGIYKLSNMAAGHFKEESNRSSLESELQALKLENERLKREKRRACTRCERYDATFN